MRAVASLLLWNKCTWEEVGLLGYCTDERGYYGMHGPQVLIGAESKSFQGTIRATNPADNSGSGPAHCANPSLIQK